MVGVQMVSESWGQGPEVAGSPDEDAERTMRALAARMPRALRLDPAVAR